MPVCVNIYVCALYLVRKFAKNSLVGTEVIGYLKLAPHMRN